ncbi:MAG: response regulator, partial [Acidobacteria bacterium]|nr:response regulator [Acidobacteriota bacterium]
QLAGGIAHDFNNIITIILGYTDIALQNLPADHSAYQNVEGIRKAVNRASSLTRQLLAFGRRQVLRPRTLQLNAVVTDVQKLLTRLIGEDIELATELDPNLGSVRADAGQLEQVLMNLVINSRDAMPEGGTITIRTRNAHLTETEARKNHYVVPGSYVLLEVHDTGHGMDNETMSRMFEPFFTTKESGKGTGLGLSTVYGIVKQSGGYIWAASGPGLGTTFHVYLPITMESPAFDDSQVSALRSQGSSEVVLLVEDETELRALLSQSLRKCGFVVLEAVNGIEALAMACTHRQPIDIVVTDMVMPRMGGRSLVSQLAADHPETAVLYMSGYSNDAAIRRDGLAPEMHFLQKPFEPHILARKIREVLDSRAA